MTPLYNASDNGHKEIVSALIVADADVIKANNYGNTPLYIASCNGHKEIVSALISAGSDVNQGW